MAQIDPDSSKNISFVGKVDCVITPANPRDTNGPGKTIVCLLLIPSTPANTQLLRIVLVHFHDSGFNHDLGCRSVQVCQDFLDLANVFRPIFNNQRIGSVIHNEDDASCNPLESLSIGVICSLSLAGLSIINRNDLGFQAGGCFSGPAQSSAWPECLSVQTSSSCEKVFWVPTRMILPSVLMDN